MPTRSRRQLGEYTLGKTLGAGSMGKVKLAISSVSGEKIAIKIIPRHTSLSAAQQQIEREKNKENTLGGPSTTNDKDSTPLTSTLTPSFIEKAKSKDISKEIRTIREASIVLLLHHPYVCGMKSMLVYPHHCYMLFEYVNGGQMLDYIISHGRLRERAARKFARQMGSALEYCHANSIVHRDLKIENILISKTGNIKIIDFGLSNLFSPNSNLHTFCGSLYFAAPELLNAKVYIGPEVDVWSFGIVLYVLVCGKVPFDDQSMPALHAKIKRGQVEYPTWLSHECKHLLSRMLVTSPSNRASLQEVLHHSWIVKGYDGPPDPHIPHREPLRLHQIDPEVIKGMTGFEFGSPEKIETDLRAVLSSEMYVKVLKLYDDRRSGVTHGLTDLVYNTAHSGSSSSMSPIVGSKRDSRIERDSTKTSTKPSKRFSGFGFYGKKVAGGLAAVLNTVGGTKSDDKPSPDPNSSLLNGFESILLNGQTLDSLDPTRGFHPLISIYFLVREKIERERIYGPGVFASSTLSVTGPPPPPVPPSAYRGGLVPSGTTAVVATLDDSISTSNQLRPHAPNRSTNDHRPSTGGPEDHGKQRDPSSSMLSNLQSSVHPPRDRYRIVPSRPNTATDRLVSTPLPSAPTSPKNPSEFPQLRSKIGHAFNPANRRSVHIMTAPESNGPIQALTDPVASSSQRHEFGRADRIVSMLESNPRADPERSPSGFTRRFGSLLGRSASVNDPDFKRHRPRSSIGLGHKSSSKTPLGALPQVTESSARSPPYSPGGLQDQQQAAQQACLVPSEISLEAAPLSAPITGQALPRVTPKSAKSDLDANLTPRNRHHLRGSSTGAGLIFDTITRPTEDKPIPHSASSGSSSWRPRLTSLNGKIKRSTSPAATAPSNVLSESEEEPSHLDEDADQPPTANGLPDHDSSPRRFPQPATCSTRTTVSSSKPSDKIKPVYLKGLFSVATTSTRGPQVLRSDLVNVLNRIGFQHREIKGGFECAHVPSIDLSRYGGSNGINQIPTGDDGQLTFLPSSRSSKKADSMKKKASKASFGKHGNNHHPTTPERPKTNGSSQPFEDGTMRPIGSETPTQEPRTGLPSTSEAITTAEPGGLASIMPTIGGQEIRNHHPVNYPPGGLMKKYDLVVRFEIFIVKMPLLPGISGLQFRRIAGNAWQYQTFARRILQELKL